MGRFFKAPVELKLGQPTGYSNPGCYLSGTNDCCQTLTGEHVMTKNMLKRASVDKKMIKVSGHRWLKGEVKNIAINGLEARVLCKRHNSMLSPLDEAVGTAFDLIYGGLIEKKDEPKGLLVSGHDLERWAVQRFLAHDYGEGASLGGKENRASERMRTLAKRAMLEDRWEPDCGFYISVPPANALGWALETAPIIAMPMNEIIGARITLAAQAFAVIWHKPDNFAGYPLFDYRPRNVVMRRDGREIEMIISWRNGTVIGGPGDSRNVVGRSPN